ncbi:MAG: tetratricopeptide repeat protein [Bacteroidales bacterium]|nr:tetratricopeptide repeat protein [Bacteroidales bacterium]
MGFEFDNDFSFTDEPELQEVVERYRLMMRSNTPLYFDSHEFLLLIDYHLHNREYTESLKIADFGINQHPSSFDLKLKKAEVLFRLKDFTTALLLIKELENIEGSNSYLSFFRGLLHSHLKQKREAGYYFHKAVLQAQDTDEAIDILFQIAEHYQESNDLKTANYYLLEAYKIDPNDSEIIIELAQNFETYNLEQAVHYYNLYLNHHPFHSSAWFDIGVVYSRLENFEKALEAFEFAIALYDRYIEAYFNKGNALANLGRYHEAIEAFEEYTRLLREDNNGDEPEPADMLDVFCSIGECHERLGDLINAATYYNKALAIDPHYPDAIYGIGIIYSLCNNLSESLKYIRQAIDLDPFNSEYHFSLGNVYRRIGKIEKALEAYRTATNIDPKDYESWLNIAQLYFEKNLLTKAIRTLEEAYEHNPKVAIVEYRLAAYYFLKKNETEGFNFLRRALMHDNSKYLEFLKIYPEGADNEAIKNIIAKFR